jgi:TIR domain
MTFMDSGQTYDIAVSFAGEQREYVRQTVAACKAKGLRVFFDEDKTNEWWGKNFIQEQRRAYGSQTRFFVPFLSSEYLAKPIPMDEFSSAMMTAVKQGDGYILPVIMGNADVPPELLHPHIGYLRSEAYSPDQLADELVTKVKSAERAGQTEANVGKVVADALRVRLPKVTPSTYSKYEELDKIFDHLAKRLQAGTHQLRDNGFMCNVRVRDDSIRVRVEHNGNTVAGLNINKGTTMGDDKITWLVGYRNYGASNSFNGFAIPRFDKERGQAVVDVTDYNLLGNDRFDGSYDGFFDILWSKLVDQIEGSVH